MITHFFRATLWIVLATASIFCNFPPPSPIPTEMPVSIGELIRELDVVEHGPSPNQLIPVTNNITLISGDSLRITEGGEGVLDFGGILKLRLFNDTHLNQIVSESAPGSPWISRLVLERGGFTGLLIAEGSSAVFETPGGAQITVLGTTFFVVYDPGDGTTTVGNFEGIVQVVSGGQSELLSPGHFFVIPAGEPPGPELPIPISVEEFNAAARELRSPIIAVDLLIATPTATPTPTATQTPDILPPPAPIPIYPVRNEFMECEYPSWILGEGVNVVEFIWEEVFDPSGIAYYEMELEILDGDEYRLLYSLQSPDPSVFADCGYLYRWRVRAVNEIGIIGDFSDYSYFTVGPPIID